MQRCHIAQWHDGLKHSGKAGMLFRTISVQEPHEENNTVQLLASLLDADHRWTVCELAVQVGVCDKTMLHILHDILGYRKLAVCLDTSWNFRGTTMAPLCSRTGLVGPVTKGKWWLSWTNHRYGQNLCSFIRIKLETPMKWMGASQFSSSKESTPYTICCEGDVHCGI